MVIGVVDRRRAAAVANARFHCVDGLVDSFSLLLLSLPLLTGSG